MLLLRRLYGRRIIINRLNGRFFYTINANDYILNNIKTEVYKQEKERKEKEKAEKQKKRKKQQTKQKGNNSSNKPKRTGTRTGTRIKIKEGNFSLFFYNPTGLLEVEILYSYQNTRN